MTLLIIFVIAAAFYFGWLARGKKETIVKWFRAFVRDKVK